ncbi:hypothetical protein D9613_007175 [Agrocybe pediades]|uniref:Uncharacterized protein n=1 Tax=Agrocybe pediades TaxID=84607 RepID=A0A8H4QHD4_9AGAR|nr:hypothetical protein D9613_007175 [Agrocybe pediades]
MHSDHAVFPQELFDLIVDEVHRFPDKAERTQQLVTLSLVSRTFRDRAHDYLFASVMARNGSVGRRTITQLCKLFAADPLTATRGLASRITSFSCAFHPDDFTALAIILRSLFNDGTIEHTRTSPCTLSLSMFPRHDFNAQCPAREDMALALFEVCHRRRLKSLFLDNFMFFPQNYLQNASINHLSLNNTRIAVANPSDAFFLTDSELPSQSFLPNWPDEGHSISSIRRLEIKSPVLSSISDDRALSRYGGILGTYGTSLKEQEKFQPSRPTAAFPRLKTLHFSMMPFSTAMKEALEEILLGASESLEELTMAIFFRSTVSIGSLSLHRLTALRKFTLRDMEGEVGFFRFVASLLDSEPSSTLQDLELVFFFDTRGASLSDESFTETLGTLHCHAFDDMFQTSRFESVRSVTLRVRTRLSSSDYQGRNEYASVIRSQFPSIIACDNLVFNVIITDWTSRQ